jgi:acyl carrier protein
MKDKIKNIMSAVLEIEFDRISDSDDTSSIGNWDSLNHMNLIVVLEEEFNVIFDDEEIVELTSVKKIYSILTQKINSKDK